MAKIVLGMGTSHGPMLSTPPDQWGQRVQADRRNSELFFQGTPRTFDELVELRRGENLQKELGEDTFSNRFNACQAAIARLADVFAEVKPDIAVIVGDDQKEIFFDDNMPGMLVYWGDSMDNVPPTAEELAKMPPGIAVAVPGHCPPEARTYPGAPDLGRHIIEGLMDQGFEVGQSRKFPAGRHAQPSVPHAFGFVHRKIMRDDVIPNIPVFINTFYPPNQPSVRRCYEFGQALRRAIESWDGDQRVALIASGGLTHFVIEEDFDQIVVEAFRENDAETLKNLPANMLNSGNSEIRNWVTVAGSAAGNGLAFNMVDYVPCYRSEAGTGNAMGFAYWA
jgi:3-O-methylgallate 3,4-dioxygenase